jgi:hypothetical protein
MPDMGGIEGSISVSTADLDKGLQRAASMMDKTADRMAASAERSAKRREAADKRAADRAAQNAATAAKAAELAADRVARAAEAAAERQARAAERAAAAQERAAESAARRAAAEEARAAVAAEQAADRKAAAAKSAADRQIREAERAAKASARANAAYAKQAYHWSNQSDRDIADPFVGGGGMGGGASRRGGAVGRSAFNALNIGQDFFQGGPASTINNLLQPTLWSDMGAAVGGARMAIAGFGATAVVAGAAFLAINSSLKNAKLEWSDFGSVLSNLGPIEAVGDAISGLGIIVNEAFGFDVGSQISTWTSDLAEYTLGWQSAIAAAVEHKRNLEDINSINKEFAGGAAKFQSSGQKAAGAQGELFGQALADVGGSGGINGIVAKLGGTNGQSSIRGLVNGAINGNTASQDKLLNAMKAAGMDVGELDAIRAGGDPAGDREKAKKEAEDAAKEAAKAAEDAREKRVSTATGDLQDRFDKRGGQVSESEVAAALARSGADPADAGGVRAALAKSYGERVQERALKEGVDTETARGMIADDYAKADAEKARRESDRARSEAMDAATQARPGIAVSANAEYMRGVASGLDPRHVGQVLTDNLTKTLTASGMGEQQARLAAESLAGDARADAERTLTGQYEAGRAGMAEQRQRSPEIFDAAGLYNKVALAAAGGENDKQLAALNKQNDLLQQLVRLTGENGGNGQIFLR